MSRARPVAKALAKSTSWMMAPTVASLCYNMCVYIYIYIYISRERDMCIYIYIYINSFVYVLIYVCILTYIYIYIYVLSCCCFVHVVALVVVGLIYVCLCGPDGGLYFQGIDVRLRDGDDVHLGDDRPVVLYCTGCACVYIYIYI